MQKLLKNAVPHILVIFSFIFITSLYFLPQLQGKKMKSGDITHHKAMSQEVVKYEKETGNVSLWTNSMFGGMPTYQITGEQKNNLMKPVYKVQQLYIARPIGYFLGAMIGFYILMLVLGINPLLGAFGSVVFALSTNNMVLFEAGHMSKLTSVFSIPLFLTGVILTFRKKYLWGALLFSIGLAVNILQNHLQMTYLLGILTAILMVFYFFKYLKLGELKHYAKVCVIFLVGVILALATSSSKIWTTYEYSKDTMRGTPILKSENANPTSSSETEGLEWNYAMSWSNGWGDLLSSFIAGAKGGGSAEPVGKESAFAKELKRLNRGRLPSDLAAPLYWGSLPGTAGPIYFGAVIFFLFLFGALISKGQFKWWLVLGVALTMLFSLGKNFEAFNRFFFDYFPYFNKFRAPNSILSISVFLIPLLAMLGLRDLIKLDDKKQALRKLFISAGILGGISLILALIGGSLFDFSGLGDDSYAQMGLLDAIIDDRKDLLFSDSIKSFLYIGFSFLLLFYFIKGKLKTNYMILGLALIAIIDLVSVNMRYVNHNDFEKQSRITNDFKLRPVDREILKDSDPYYRVLDLSINTFNSSISSYHHKTIGGYHAAKLQRYQDIIDRHIVKGNQQVLNMLNTKYIIQGQPGQEQYSRNSGALGNAWFVDNLQQVHDANAEIEALNTIDPSKEAVYHQEYSDYIGAFDPDGLGSISLATYAPNELKFNSSSSSEQFAVFSDIWYGPDKGWKAYIDGEEVDFIRVNYAFRGMMVPAGTHEIRFEFKPRAYYVGERLSLASSGLLLLLLFFLLGKEVFSLVRSRE